MYWDAPKQSRQIFESLKVEPSESDNPPAEANKNLDLTGNHCKIQRGEWESLEENTISDF